MTTKLIREYITDNDQKRIRTILNSIMNEDGTLSFAADNKSMIMLDLDGYLPPYSLEFFKQLELLIRLPVRDQVFDGLKRLKIHENFVTERSGQLEGNSKVHAYLTLWERSNRGELERFISDYKFSGSHIKNVMSGGSVPGARLWRDLLCGNTEDVFVTSAFVGYPAESDTDKLIECIKWIQQNKIRQLYHKYVFRYYNETNERNAVNVLKLFIKTHNSPSLYENYLGIPSNKIFSFIYKLNEFSDYNARTEFCLLLTKRLAELLNVRRDQIYSGKVFNVIRNGQKVTGVYR